MNGGSSGKVRRLHLVERYWPDVTFSELEDAVAGVVRAAAELSDAGSPIRHLQSVLAVPDEVFCLFEACSAEAVARVNCLSGFAFERVVDTLVATSPGFGLK